MYIHNVEIGNRNAKIITHNVTGKKRVKIQNIAKYYEWQHCGCTPIGDRCINKSLGVEEGYCINGYGCYQSVGNTAQRS